MTSPTSASESLSAPAADPALGTADTGGSIHDSGLCALCGIAAYFRIAAGPQQLRQELALVGAEVSDTDLVRAAKLIGLLARWVQRIAPSRLMTVPTPAILALRSSVYVVFGGKTPVGTWRTLTR